MQIWTIAFAIMALILIQFAAKLMKRRETSRTLFALAIFHLILWNIFEIFRMNFVEMALIFRALSTFAITSASFFLLATAIELSNSDKRLALIGIIPFSVIPIRLLFHKLEITSWGVRIVYGLWDVIWLCSIWLLFLTAIYLLMRAKKQITSEPLRNKLDAFIKRLFLTIFVPTIATFIWNGLNIPDFNSIVASVLVLSMYPLFK